MSEVEVSLSRGGMCSNPFGGADRIDRINLLDFLEPNCSADKVLYSCIIQDAVSNYLYAFLGKNGTSAEEFFAAWQYFFKVESTNRVSWDHHRTIKQSYIHRGDKITRDRYLTDSELQMMCFDKHYDLSGLSEHMHIDRFRSKLKEKRYKVLSDNLQQVQSYIHSLYQHELSQIADGQQVPLQVWNEDLLKVLVDPPTPMHLASIIYVPNKLKRARRKRTNKQLSRKIKAAAIIPALGNNWGPLAVLLAEVENDQAISNDISDCFHSNTD